MADINSVCVNFDPHYDNDLGSTETLIHFEKSYEGRHLCNNILRIQHVVQEMWRQSGYKLHVQVAFDLPL